MPEKTRESKGPFSRIRSVMKEREEEGRLAAAFSAGNAVEVKRICESAEPGAVIRAIDEAARRGWWPIVDHAVENCADRVAMHAVDAEVAGRRWRALLDLSNKPGMNSLGVLSRIRNQFRHVRTDEVEDAIRAQDWSLVEAFSDYAEGPAAKIAKEAYERNVSGTVTHLTEKAGAAMTRKVENAGHGAQGEGKRRFHSLRQPY